MADGSKLHEAAHLHTKSHQLGRRATDLTASAQGDGLGHDERRNLQQLADDTKAQAQALTDRANDLLAQYAPQVEPEMDTATEQDKAERARAWYLPGTTADQDVMLQVEEAEQGPALFNQLGKYALRGLVERDGPVWDAVTTAASVAGEGLAQDAADVGQVLNEVVNDLADATTNALDQAGEFATNAVSAITPNQPAKDAALSSELGTKENTLGTLLDRYAPHVKDQPTIAKGQEKAPDKGPER